MQETPVQFLGWSLGLKIIPVINKVDLNQSDADIAEEQIWEVLKDPVTAERVSAKTGLGIEHLLERIVEDIPAPQGNVSGPVRALIFDSYYDAFRGVIVYVRMIDGTIKAGQTLKLMASGFSSKIEEVGIMTPKLEKCQSLQSGEVGYVIAGIKDIHQVQVGDTITIADNPATQPLQKSL